MSKDFPERRPNRLRKYNYNKPGLYFITVCLKERDSLFGKVSDGKMILSKYGCIADKCWKEISDHFENVELDEFIIMPDHIHGIIVVKKDVVRSNANAVGNAVGSNDRWTLQKTNRNMETIPKIISQFKSSVTRTIRKEYQDSNFAWQKSYYDRIIRDDDELYEIRKYILNNPKMLSAQKELHEAKTDSDKKIYQQRVDILDKQIDSLVYELYGLTDEEIKIVEETV